MPIAMSIIISVVLLSFIIFAIIFKYRTQKTFLNILLTLSKIYSAILIPLLLAYISFYVQSISESLEFQKHDLAILEEFQTTYFQPTERGLSLRYIGLMRSKEAKNHVRKFIIWDILYRNIATPKNRKHQSFTFDSTNLDWHWLGEDLGGFFTGTPEEKKENIAYYLFVKRQALIDFSDYARPEQIKAVFSWEEKNYHFKLPCRPN